MDSMSTIVTAFAAGAAARLKTSAEQSIKDSYDALKAYLQHRYSIVDISVLEKKPGSKPRQQVFAEELTDAGAELDEGLIRLSHELLDLIQQHEPTVIFTIGVDLSTITKSRVDSDAEDGEFTGGIDIRSVLAGKKDK